MTLTNSSDLHKVAEDPRSKEVLENISAIENYRDAAEIWGELTRMKTCGIICDPNTLFDAIRKKIGHPDDPIWQVRRGLQDAIDQDTTMSAIELQQSGNTRLAENLLRILVDFGPAIPPADISRLPEASRVIIKTGGKAIEAFKAKNTL